jgi:hypothetical protein
MANTRDRISERRRSEMTRMVAIAAALWLGQAGAVHAQNLVVNGDFATDVSGWSTAYHGSGITIAWSSLDPADPTASGSLEVTSTISNGGAGGATQCVDLLVANPELRMDVMVPSQPGFAYVNAAPYVRWFLGAGCSVGEISTESVLGTVPDGTDWTRLTGPLSPPPTAQAVLLDLAIAKPSGSSAAAVAYFDNVYLPEPGGTALGATVCAVLAALAWLSSPRRSRPPV